MSDSEEQNWEDDGTRLEDGGEELVELYPTSSDGTTPSMTPQAATPSHRQSENSALFSGDAAKKRLRPSQEIAPGMEQELELFRREWQKEILQRRTAPPMQPMSEGAAGAQVAERSGKSREIEADVKEVDPESDTPSPSQSVSQAQSSSNISSSTIARAMLPVSSSTSAGRPMAPYKNLSGARIHHYSDDAPNAGNPGTKTKINDAIETYAVAVAMERKGDLDEALVNYRKAFRLNSNADQLYARAAKFVTDKDTMRDMGAASSQHSPAFTDSVTAQVRASIEVEDYRAVRIRKRQAAGDRAGGSTGPPPVDSRTSVEPGVGGAVDELTALIDTLYLEANKSPSTEANESALRAERGGIRFEPEDEERPVLLARLPDELIIQVLGWVVAPRGRRGAKVVRSSESNALAAASANISPEVVSAPLPGQAVSAEVTKPRKVQGIGISLAGPDWHSLEATALTCWKLRMVSRASTLWKTCVQETYYPPQILIPPDSSLSRVHEDMYSRHGNWRSVLIDEPRIRLNGAYIAPCHYTREGMSEESAWVRVVHVVEFYRSLRFLPDGQALSLLTTDIPSDTVRRMEPSLRMKGFMVGQWRLFPRGLPQGAEVDGLSQSSSDGEESGGRHRKAARKHIDMSSQPVVLVTDLRDTSMPNYSFRMLFALRQTSRGKFNKIDLLSYASFNERTGEILPLPRRHARPFIFSRVKAYGL